MTSSKFPVPGPVAGEPGPAAVPSADDVTFRGHV